MKARAHTCGFAVLTAAYTDVAAFADAPGPARDDSRLGDRVAALNSLQPGHSARRTRCLPLGFACASSKPAFSKSGTVPVYANAAGIGAPGFGGFTG